VVATTVDVVLDEAPPSVLGPWVSLLFNTLVVLALGAFHGAAETEVAGVVRPRRWLVANAFGVGFVVAMGLPTDGVQPVFDWAGICSVALVVATLVHLRVGSPVWSHALAVLAVGGFVLRVTTLLDYLVVHPFPGRSTLLAFGVVEAAAVLAVAVPLAASTARRLRMRRLPDEDDTAPVTR
jgi:hypothetical protein